MTLFSGYNSKAEQSKMKRLASEIIIDIVLFFGYVFFVIFFGFLVPCWLNKIFNPAPTRMNMVYLLPLGIILWPILTILLIIPGFFFILYFLHTDRGI